jgi:MerR family copper efflux transcriptional regulator
MTIGGLAHAAGVPVETVRYYERRGLLPPPPRTPAGYRQYGDDDVWRLGFVRRAKALGFTLTEVGSLLGAVPHGPAPRGASSAAAEVRAAAIAKLEEVDAGIAALRERRAQLLALVDVCLGGDDEGCASLASDCPG